jgi:hypothetical protein
MFEFKGMRDIDVRSLGVDVLGNSPAFNASRSVSVFVRWSPPSTPGGDTVATSGFPLPPLWFTCVLWTAEFGVRGVVTVPSLLVMR